MLLLKLVALENAIDPKKTDSPAYNCNVVLKQYLRSVAEKARAEAVRLQKNYEMSQKRISKITDEKKKAEAYNRAAERRTSGLASLQLNAVEMELIPEALTVDGYVELFKFWWENVGKGLPDADLRRIMHPMLMFAKIMEKLNSQEIKELSGLLKQRQKQKKLTQDSRLRLTYGNFKTNKSFIYGKK